MIKRLLVPLDGSALAEQALPVAAAIARAFDATIDITVVHRSNRGHDERFPSDEELSDWKTEDAYAERIANALQTRVDGAVSHGTPSGDPVDMICARTRDLRADLIVMTSHGRTGISRAWMGSIADGVMRKSHVPILMLRAAELEPHRLTTPLAFERVLVPLDGSALAADIVPIASDLARCGNGRIVLLRVVRPVPMITADPDLLWAGAVPADEAATRTLVAEAKKDLGELGRRLERQGIRNLEIHVTVHKQVARAILDFAHEQEVDVICMSTHGRGASRLVLGSVADKVLRGATMPVVLRRPAEIPAESRWIDAAAVEEQLHAISGR